MLSLAIICLSMAFPVAFSNTTTCDQVDGIRPPIQNLVGVNWYVQVVYPYKVEVQCCYFSFTTDSNGNLAEEFVSAASDRNISNYEGGSQPFFYASNATNNNVINSGNRGNIGKFLAFNDGTNSSIPKSVVILGCNPNGKLKGVIFICTSERVVDPEDVVNIENAVNEQWPSLNIQPANNTYINQKGCVN